MFACYMRAIIARGYCLMDSFVSMRIADLKFCIRGRRFAVQLDCDCRTPEATMAFVLVKWLEEGYISTIPSSWVVQPRPIPTAGFPVAAICYWKRKTSRWDTEILAVSGMHIQTRYGLHYS